MLTRLSLACSGLAMIAAAQSPRPDISQAWNEFLSRHGSGWHAEWSPATGTPVAVWGPGLTLQARPIARQQVARSHAVATLKRFKRLLGQGDSQWVEITGEKALRVFVFIYRQEFKGLEVIDGRADVFVHDNGGLSMFGSQAIPVPANFDVVPRLTVDTARRIALEHVGMKRQHAPNAKPQNDRLLIWADVDKKVPVAPRLAWEIDINNGMDRVGKAYVGAAKGAVLEYRNDIFECCKRYGLSGNRRVKPAQPEAATPGEPHIEVIPDPNPDPNSATVGGTIMAWTNTNVLPDAALVNAPVPFMKIGSTFTDASGKFTLPGNTVTVSIGFVGKHSGQVTAMQGTTFTRTLTLTGNNNTIQIFTQNAAQFDRSQSTCYWYMTQSNVFMRKWMGPSASLDRMNGITGRVNIASSCNATYSSFNTNYYHAANGCVNTAYASVVQHEWGHGLDDAFGGLQRGECQEGMADTVAIMQNDDPIVGHKFWNRNPNYVRTATNTRTYPAGGGVHQQGETWMGWMWDCRNNLVTRRGKAAGVAIMQRLFSNVFKTSPTTQPAGVRNVFIIDDNDNDLSNGTPNCKSLRDAAIKRKLPVPVNRCSTAEYKVFGIGCKGTGPTNPNCTGLNVACTNAETQGNRSIFAIELRAGKGADIVAGVDLYTKSTAAGPTTMNVAIHFPDSKGAPKLTAEVSTKMPVTTTHKMHSATFAKPIVVPQDQKYFVVFDTPTTTLPWCRASGAQNIKYYLRGPNDPSWLTGNGSWIFKVRCTGGPGAIPVMTNTDIPEINSTMSLVVTLAAKTAPAALMLGGSKTKWGNINLPLDLTGAGATGCNLYISPDLFFGVATDGNGRGEWKLTLPNDTALLKIVFFNQFLIIDQGANPLHVTLSNGGEGKVGKASG